MEGDKAQILIDTIDGPSFKTVIALLETLEEPEDVLLKRQKML
jgi:hypothetical protein